MANSFADQFYLARKVSGPLVVARTPDARASIAALSARADISKALNQDVPPVLVEWDTVRGLMGINPAGRALAKDVSGKDLLNLSDLLTIATAFPAHTVLFAHFAHRAWTDTATIVSAWNLRDAFKANFRTLVLLVPPSTVVPKELAGDVIILDEELPDRDTLVTIIRELVEGAGVKTDDAQITRAADAVAGLTHFSAEQVVAMSLTKAGIDIDAVWERKRQTVEMTPGLRVRRDGMKLDTVIGYDNAKSYLRKIVGRFNTILFIDEIEKGVAGWGSDSSGVSQDFHQSLLTFLDRPGTFGVLAVGHPGTGKSATAAALGTDAGIPTVIADLGGMKAKHVGDSEANIRAALSTTLAIGAGRVLVIATANAIGGLSPELRRRFGATFFFDLPSAAELGSIWDLYIAKPHVDAEGPLSAAQAAVRPPCEGWTGAEVKRCCETAWRLSCTLTEAAGYVVPVSQAMPERIAKLRAEADGAYINASRPGVYRQVEADIRDVPAPLRRAVATMRES